MCYSAWNFRFIVQVPLCSGIMFWFENTGPSVDSNDPQQRMQARRERIQRRKDRKQTQSQTVSGISSMQGSTTESYVSSFDKTSDKAGGSDGEKTSLSSQTKEPTKSEYSVSKKQMKESMEVLEKLIKDGINLMTNVEVAVDVRESKWRNAEQHVEVDRREKLEHELKAGVERFKEIEKRWEEIFLKTVPQELYFSLTEQKSSCDSVIKEKNKLIVDLKKELEHKEVVFNENVKKQAADINLIVDRMNEHVRIMKRAYKDEVHAMELAFTEERQQMLQDHHKKWSSVLTAMHKKEDDVLAGRLVTLQEHQDHMDKQWITEMEDFNILKHKLETDIMQLELEFRNLKASILINQERLEYNYHVLRKRDEESTIMKSNQKRRLTRMHDVMANLKTKLGKLQKQFQEENQNLTEDYKKTVNLLLDLEKKSNHFQAADIKTFKEVWKLNEEEAKVLAKKLVNLDRIIHEQHLGIPWEQPNTQFMKNIGPWGSYTQSAATASTVDKAKLSVADLKKSLECAPTTTPAILSAVAKTLMAPDRNLTPTALRKSPSDGINNDIPPPPPPTAEETNTLDAISVQPTGLSSRDLATIVDVPQVTLPLVRKILLLLCDESGFLVEERVLHILEPLQKSGRNLMKVNNIFNALGIYTEPEIQVLAKYFVRYIPHMEVDEQDGGQVGSATGESASRQRAASHSAVDFYPSRKTTSPIPPEVRHTRSLSAAQTPTTTSRTTSVRSSAVSLGSAASSVRTSKHTSSFPLSLLSTEVVRSNDVLQALRDFVNDHRKVRTVMDKIPTLYCQQMHRNVDADDQYWQRYVEVIPEEHRCLWDALIPALEKYHNNLIEREKLMKSTESLRCQNSELRVLLDQYIKSKINEELAIPPTADITMVDARPI